MTRTRPAFPIRDARIVRAYQAGATLKLAGAPYRLSTHQVADILAANGVMRRSRGKQVRFTDRECGELAARYDSPDARETYASLAREHGCSIPCIAKSIQRGRQL